MKTLGRVIVSETNDGTQETLIDVYKLSVKDIDYIVEELQAQKKLMEKWNNEKGVSENESTEN